MTIRFAHPGTEDLQEMVDIFNDHVDHSTATFTESRLTPELFELLMPLYPGYPALKATDASGVLAGFGMLRPFSLIPVFSATAEITCFLRREFIRLGIGSRLVGQLEFMGREIGLATIVATVSSLNEASIRFHESLGYRICGRIVRAGLRRGHLFDIVYLQKML